MRLSRDSLHRHLLSGDTPCVLALILLCLGLYANTLVNGYVFDDLPLFTENTYVQQGWRGIPTLLTSDVFRSLYEQRGIDNVLEAGRYRPLSLVTFAVEVGLLGQRPWFSHLVNVLLYTALLLVLFRFLCSQLLPGDRLTAFVVTLLFAIHPIHAEVVANVKSRDEILSLLFILLCLGNCTRSTVKTLVFFVLALLSKEYAVTLLVLVPVLLHLRDRQDRMTRTLAGLVVTFLAYLVVRYACVGLGGDGQLNILDAPYAYATTAQAWATKLVVLLHDLRLLVWPHPLSYDYSYAQVPYTTFADPRVWISLSGHVCLAIVGCALAWRRSVVGFGILFYLGPLALVSNLLVNAGVVMGDRMLFHSSLGFCLLVGIGSTRLARHRPTHRPLILTVAAVLSVLASAAVVQRNADWKDASTLYIRDAQVAPNSALVLCNAGAQYLDLFYRSDDPRERERFLAKAILLTQRGLGIYPEDEIAQLNLGAMVFEQGNYEIAEHLWQESSKRLGKHPQLLRYITRLADTYFVEGEQAARVRAFKEAEVKLLHAVRLDPGREKAWLALGGVYMEAGYPKKADKAWRRVSKPVVWKGFKPIPSVTADPGATTR